MIRSPSEWRRDSARAVPGGSVRVSAASVGSAEAAALAAHVASRLTSASSRIRAFRLCHSIGRCSSGMGFDLNNSNVTF